jgi:hypothetical protein
MESGPNNIVHLYRGKPLNEFEIRTRQKELESASVYLLRQKYPEAITGYDYLNNPVARHFEIESQAIMLFMDDYRIKNILSDAYDSLEEYINLYFDGILSAQIWEQQGATWLQITILDETYITNEQEVLEYIARLYDLDIEFEVTNQGQLGREYYRYSEMYENLETNILHYPGNDPLEKMFHMLTAQGIKVFRKNNRLQAFPFLTNHTPIEYKEQLIRIRLYKRYARHNGFQIKFMIPKPSGGA